MKYKSIHFIGAGGVGVAGLAHLCADLGCQVTGSDIADSAMLESLARRGVPVWLGSSPERMGHPDLVVYSAAVPDQDAERLSAKTQKIPQLRRGAFLNELALEFPVRIAVSGSHGKTTTSAMLAHILRETGRQPAYLVGGSVNGWERSASAGAKRIFVTEVDESDASQAGFPATTAIVLNIDDDHSWAIGGRAGLEQCFMDLCANAQHILAWRTPETARLFSDNPRCSLLDTPLPPSSGLPVPGPQFREDAAMALAAAELHGVPPESALSALRCFPGVSRRMSVRANFSDARILIEDYAHHPAELQATLSALREAYPGHRILVVFQPHRLERVERYGARFAELLSTVDWCCVLAPFGAWRTDDRHVDVRGLLTDRITVPCIFTDNMSEAATSADREWHRPTPAVLAVIGAGDVIKVTRLLLDSETGK